MPSTVREKYDSLPPRHQNNARSIFMSDWEKIGTSEAKEIWFAEKWGIFHQLADGLRTDAKPVSHEEDMRSLLEAAEAGVF